MEKINAPLIYPNMILNYAKSIDFVIDLFRLHPKIDRP